MELINRPEYVNKITKLLNRDVMLFLVGQRRVGKSFILMLVKKWIEEHSKDANVVYINKEFEFDGKLNNAAELYKYATERLPEGGENYLLIDEVQDIEDYEKALRSLQAERRCQIIATGSNAYIFSSELSTKIAGRHIEIPIYNLSYEEFLRFHRLEDSDESMQTFLRVGGLPGLTHFDLNEISQVRDYLFGVYNTIMLQDVINREKIRNTTFIKNLSNYIADNIGKLFSVRNIDNTLKSTGEATNASLTTSYLNYLTNALLINHVSRYDIHGKKLFETLGKYYFSDHGLRNLLCGFNVRGSIEKLIENVIYLHLLRRGYDVNVGILRAGEIDFVATKLEEKIYVQATYLLSSSETIEREFGNLAAINDNYPKYVVSMDPISGDIPDFPGIKHVSLRKFLLS